MTYKPRIILLVRRSEALESLLEAANEQGGYVTAAQAARLGLERDDVARLVRSEDLQRVRRGVFRMRHAQTRHEDEIAAWLHFERDRLPWERDRDPAVVVSNDSAAALQTLGTIIPQRPTVTVPAGSGRSPHVTDIEVRRAPLRDTDWTWMDVGGVQLPVTTPARTIIDLVLDNHEPSYLRRAVAEAIERGAATADEIMDAARHRKSHTQRLQARTAALLDAAA
jgi:predicted transcriptional regulator of viral defense system